MQAAVRKKIDLFRESPDLQSRFEAGLDQVSLEALLWPEKHPGAFGREWKAGAGKNAPPYPLLDPDFQLKCVGAKIEGMIDAAGAGAEARARHAYMHPALAFYYLSRFQESFKPGKGRKDTRAAKEKKSYYNKVQKFKRRLAVPARLARAKDPAEMLDRLLEIFDETGRERLGDLEQLASMEAEVANYRNPEYLHPEQKQRLENLIVANAELEMALGRERGRNESLEREVDRLAEQIISTPVVPEEVYDQETETLRREYAILSNKCDALVSKNIELSNQVQKFNSVKTLGQILDIIRDKINGVLRAGVHEKDDVLLTRIQNEIEQLQRARVYLGRALFDVGLLYLRVGEKDRARTEFRAARELGVEDPEIDQIINRS